MLKEKMQKDIVIAMKEKAKDERDLLRFVMAQIKQKEVDTRTDATDVDVVAIIKKEIRQTEEARLIADSTTLRWRVDFLNRYLPKQMSSDEIEVVVSEAATKYGTMKECMAFCMSKYGSYCDKKELSAAVRSRY